MKNILGKITVSFTFLTLLLFAGVFFGFSNVWAADMNMSALNCEKNINASYNLNCEAVNRGIVSAPIDHVVMPCCIERHDNSETVLPTPLQERIKFSEFGNIENTVVELEAIKQKTYLSSKSPPQKADILSSIVKIE
jgi:hypothetical protein